MDKAQGVEYIGGTVPNDWMLVFFDLKNRVFQKNPVFIHGMIISYNDTK